MHGTLFLIHDFSLFATGRWTSQQSSGDGIVTSSTEREGTTTKPKVYQRLAFFYFGTCRGWEDSMNEASGRIQSMY